MFNISIIMQLVICITLTSVYGMQSMLIDGLLKQESATTASQLALWQSFNIWKVAFRHIRTALVDEQRVNSLLSNETHNLLIDYGDIPGALQADLLISIAKHLGIEYRNTTNKQSLDQLGQNIELHTIQLVQKSSKGQFKGNSTPELIRYNLQTMFDTTAEGFNSKSPEEQKEITRQIITLIKSMPDNQKELVLSKLRINKLSHNSIGRIIAAGGLGTAFVAVVDAAGFSAYIFAVKALSAVSGAIGLTLPFTAYTGLTSFIALFANPIIVIPGSISLGYILTKRGNKLIRNAYLPTLVSQIAVYSTLDSTANTDPRAIIGVIRDQEPAHINNAKKQVVTYIRSKVR